MKKRGYKCEKIFLSTDIIELDHILGAKSIKEGAINFLYGHYHDIIHQ